jgi:hypothetical protein
MVCSVFDEIKTKEQLKKQSGKQNKDEKIKVELNRENNL